MSKPCQGIAVKPITGAELAKLQPAVPASRYLAPWMRKSAPKEETTKITTEDLASTDMFPVLKPMEAGSVKGASWSQISTRLAQPITMKAVVEEAMERERLATEQNLQANEKDRWNMTDAELEAAGWTRISVKMSPERIAEYKARMQDQ